MLRLLLFIPAFFIGKYTVLPTLFNLQLVVDGKCILYISVAPVNQIAKKYFSGLDILRNVLSEPKIRHLRRTCRLQERAVFTFQ